MLKIDEKLKEDLEIVAQNKINALTLKALQSTLRYEEIESSFRTLLSDISNLVIEYLDNEYFENIKEYKKKLLSFVVLYVDELKSKFLMEARKLNAGVLDQKQYTKKLSQQPKAFAFLLTTAIVTNTTTLINFMQIKLAYQNGLISYDAYGILKDKFLGKETTKNIKNADDLKYLFVGYIDKKTCRCCKSLNGKKFKLSALIKGINAPPLHPNCRCKILII